MTLRALGYTRTSTEDQRTRPEDDHARIVAACQAYSYDLVDVVVDVGVSGKVPLVERPNGKRVHALIEASGRKAEADVLIVTKLDRLTRSSEDGLDLIRQLMPSRGRRHAPVRLMSLDDHIDLAGASGRMTAKLHIVLAEYERELIGERTSNALRHKRRTNQKYSQVPFGWDCDDDNHLTLNPAEQQVLADMQRMRNQGVTDSAIARALNAEGVPTKRNGTWAPTTVYRILKKAEEMQ